MQAQVKTLTASGLVINDGNGGGNYTISYATNATGVITARALTLTTAANSKTYDGTTSAAAAPTVTSGAIQTGDVSGFTETYDTKNVGTNKTLTPAGTVTDGNSGNNYTYTFVSSTTGTITARALTLTAATNNKVYDGTTSAAATPTVTSGAIQTGDVANFTETYDTKNVGTVKTLTPAGTVTDGNSGNNYTYTFVTNTTGIITTRALTITAATNTKTYDGTTGAAAVPTVTSGVIQTGDVVNFIEIYNNKNVGNGKTLTASGTVTDGNSGNNYSYSFATNSTGVITAKAITVTAATDSKTYNGTTSSVGVPTYSLQAGDATTTAPTQTFNNKNVGSGKTLTASGLVINDGNSGNNYTISYATNTTGIINARALTITAVTNSKTFDGTTSAAAIPTVTSGAIQTGDAANFSETYDTKFVGSGKTLTPAGTATDGNSGGNYSYTFVTSATGTIVAGAFTQLQILLPGETASVGSASGKTGSPTAQIAGTAFTVTVNAVDAFWNVVTSTDNVNITSSDVNASMPANAALVSGTKTFSVTLVTGGTATITASDATNNAITSNTSASVTINAGALKKLQVLLPGETAAPGTVTGKTGTPSQQTTGTAFNVIVNGVDVHLEYALNDFAKDKESIKKLTKINYQ